MNIVGGQFSATPNWGKSPTFFSRSGLYIVPDLDDDDCRSWPRRKLSVYLIVSLGVVIQPFTELVV